MGEAKSILIVEDHPDLRASLKSLLEQAFPDCELTEAKDGEIGVSEACLRCPDVVLMDIRMPRTNGLEAARRIREARPKTKVVALTAHDNAEYRLQAARVGMSGYVLKDDAHRDLVPLLRKLMEDGDGAKVGEAT